VAERRCPYIDRFSLKKGECVSDVTGVIPAKAGRQCFGHVLPFSLPRRSFVPSEMWICSTNSSPLLGMPLSGDGLLALLATVHTIVAQDARLSLCRAARGFLFGFSGRGCCVPFHDVFLVEKAFLFTKTMCARSVPLTTLDPYPA
jgi:hypothetical protein